MRSKAGAWVLAVIGVILLIAGLAWGLGSSKKLTYISSQENVTYRIAVGTQSDNVYIHADGSDEYFVALKGDFTPAIAQSDIDNSTSISYIARPDTTSISLDANGTTIDEAHKIEKLVFYDKTGATMASYATTEYTANPNGLSVNSWSQAIWLVVLGLLLAVAGFISAMRKRNTNFSINNTGVPVYQPGPPAYPPTQPGAPYPQTDPYGQPYQGSGQYPPQGSGQYPQSNPYNQPNNNPYQQPPQGY